jgi:hypothetical protein
MCSLSKILLSNQIKLAGFTQTKIILSGVVSAMEADQRYGTIRGILLT